VWSYISPNEGFLKRTLDYMSYMVTATIAAQFIRRVDIVVATSPQFFTAISGYLVALAKRRAFVFELRDLWPESIKAVGALQQKWILRALEAIELFLYSRADLIVSVTKAFRDNLVRRGVSEAKIAVITNGVDLFAFWPGAKSDVLLDRYGLRDKFVVGYVGTLGMAHALETVLEAAQLVLATPLASNVTFLFIGDGARRNHLMAKSRDMGLTNVLFLESVSKSQVREYWSLLDATIIHLRNTELFTTVIPSKLFEAMAMGVPVLLGVAGESSTIVRQENAGILFEPENAGALADAITMLARDQNTCTFFSKGARAGAAKYDRNDLASQMLALLEKVVQVRCHD
jgi:glycosyltransferase involved in cell wall biosynthesis